MKNLAIVLGALSLMAGCVVGDSGDEGASDENIIGGTLDTGDPSVVRLLIQSWDGNWSACTATVITPTALLTAAHCVSGALQVYYNANVTADPAVADGWIKAKSSTASWSYDGNAQHGYDVGVVRLASPTTLPPIALGAGPAVSSSVRAVGYGNTTPTSGNSGNNNRNAVTMTVSSTTALIFAAGQEGQGTCHGDSGGPVFQNGQLVGTTSYGTTSDCHGVDYFSRVDANRSFIDFATQY